MISLAAGLQPNDRVVPPVAIVGGVESSVHIAVLDAVDVLPHASVATHVLVCDREHPVLTTAASLCNNVVDPQASVAVAVPSALLIDEAAGLHPRLVEVPPVVIVGAVLSLVHVTVLDIVAVLPQSSVALNVRVCERVHELLLIEPSVIVIFVMLLHPSVALAEPSAFVISEGAELHPKGIVEYEPVNVGGVLSDIHVIVLDVVEVLPHASFAVNVLVCVRSHPLL